MKTKFALLAFLVAARAAFAAPLPTTTAVHAQPDANSPAIATLKAGTEPKPAANALSAAPSGWLAVELEGPFEGYVPNKDIAKSLDVKIGAQIRVAPKNDATVITTMEAADKSEITGLHGRWTQVKIEKTITGYIYLGTTQLASQPSADTPPAADPAPLQPAPVAPVGQGVTAAGKSVSVNLASGNGETLPRLFQGKFVSTRSPFKPRRPYDWALHDDAGKRYAYLDISKLLLTEQIESYADHVVVVYGAARPGPDGKEMVIQVESLQLK
mgnify:CR=1 FL=1|jgi:hypothetical protein